MSQPVDDPTRRRELLKHMILQLHQGEAPDAVRPQLVRLLGQVPYDLVVAVEQELIDEGLPAEEVQKLCDVHTEALDGAVDTSKAKAPPPGHPAHTFSQENRALEAELAPLAALYDQVRAMADEEPAGAVAEQVRGRFNALMDVEKHYQRKENLLFPLLEKQGITGPPKVMWGKHDEARELLKGAIQALEAAGGATAGELGGVIDLVLAPASEAVAGMVDKEEQILLPMCMDALGEADWYEVARGSAEIGYCLYVPEEEWAPEGVEAAPEAPADSGKVHLGTGTLGVGELEAILNTVPFDLTFVDAEDKVRYFSHGKERIFPRTKAILGRQVQYCHPPSSVATVDRILDDFKEGKQSRAGFWIQLGERFVSIEYFAVRDPDGTYLGTLEVSQDLTAKRALSGQRRLLSYDDEEC